MSKQSKKQKNQQINDKLNLNIAKEITIKFIDGDINFIDNISNSSLFKIYLKNQLQNKNLSINFIHEMTFINSKISIQIESCKLSDDNEINNNNFIIDINTSIFINKENIQMDLLSNELENKISLSSNENIKNDKELTENNKNILKELIENKLLSNSNKGNSIIVDKERSIELINNEDIYKKIIDILSIQLKDKNHDPFENIENNVDSSNKLLLNKNNQLNYIYKGIILSGSSGIGKSYLINYLKESYLKIKKITYFDIDIYKNLKDKDQSIKYIKSIFKFANLLNPSVIFIEDIDLLFPKKDENDNNTSQFEYDSLLSTFIQEIDNLNPNSLLIASSTNSNKINIDLLKSNRLDLVYQISLPNFEQRKKAINYFLKDFANNLNQNDIDSLSDKTHGFVIGDIIKLFKESYLQCINQKEETLTKKILDDNISNIKPINLKDILLDIPKVKWSDIGGNKNIINQIRQSVEWPLKHEDKFLKLGITPPHGTLLYGPPGCSKTMIAKALATETGLNFFAVKGPELFSKYVGDTEKAIRDIFKKARISAPSIIFFDEIDSMASQRGENNSSGVEDKVLCQLLNEMDGIEGRKKVVIFAATNRPDILDKALIRPGRFDRLIYIPNPDVDGRIEIFNILFSKMKISKDVDVKELANLTEFFSGADINKVCNEAGMIALNENIDTEVIEKKHILESIKNTKPIINEDMIQFFEKFQKKSIFD